MRMTSKAAVSSCVLVLTAVCVGAGVNATSLRHGQLAQSAPTITVQVTNPGSGNSSGGGADDDGDSGSSGDTGEEDPCQYVELRSGITESNAGTYATDPLFRAALELSTMDPPSASLYTRICPDQPQIGYWVPDGVGEVVVITVDDLVPSAFDDAVAAIPDPSLDMSPPEEVGGIVNIGLWLAVEESDPVTARAEAGAVWAQATATLTGLTWDMGNGDVVECEGFGYPIVDLDTREQSPACGYTYEWPSHPKYTGAGYGYEVSVTAHWNVQITGSDGRDVSAGSVDSTYEFLYPVCEVQVLGAAPGSDNPTEGMSCAEVVGIP